MTKTIIKALSIIFLFIVLIIFYLSIFGIKTDKFNNKITNKILQINKKINVDLGSISFLLNPYNLTINVIAKNPRIKLKDNELKIKSIKTNISLRALLKNQFLIDDLQISTKANKLNNIILLIRSFKNSVELFLLDSFIKDGSLTTDIKIYFDNKGNLKDDYEIKGFVENGKFNFFNKFNIKNLNFNFDVNKKKYLLTEVKAKLSDIDISSPLIKFNQKKDLLEVKGSIATKEKDFDTKKLSILPNSLLTNSSIAAIRFSSTNDFSFNIGQKLKFKDLNIESKVFLNQLDIKNSLLSLKSYFPTFNEIIKLENHKIKINYTKNKLYIKGNGGVSIDDKFDFLKYQIIKKKDQFFFDTEINLRNKLLLIDFLDYKKNEGSDASLLIKGNFKRDNPLKFDLISFKEKNNKILIKNINLNKDFKLTSIDIFDVKYLNRNNILNQFVLKKRKASYDIVGVNFDATKLINKIMSEDKNSSSLFDNFDSKVNIKINKTFIDEINYIDNLSGTLNFKNNKINEANLKSAFPNKKKINLTISTNNKQEKITRLFTDHPKPLIRRYNFIKGFEDGYLNYYSIKKNAISNSLLIIDNFKIKEVSIFAKLLSLASLQGIADLLTGEGIRFTNFEMKTSNKNNLTTIEEMYAIGPAISLLMDGYIDSTKLVSLRGTLVPATTINRTIASIPILGSILVGKKNGEGVFGVSFKVKGPPNDLNITVNPVKTLTPRFITRTLEKIKKN